MAVSTRGWRIVHAIVGVLFIGAGIWAIIHPHAAFTTLAALVGFFFLVKGIFDLTVAFMTREIFDLWWLQLILGIIEIFLAFWVAGAFQRSAILLVVYVGIVALSRGITEIFLAFKLKEPDQARRRRVSGTGEAGLRFCKPNHPCESPFGLPGGPAGEQVALETSGGPVLESKREENGR